MSQDNNLSKYSQRFEYVLETDTVLPHTDPVTYVDRGKWYKMKVKTLYPKLGPEEQIYYSIKLEFIDVEMQEIDMILWKKWSDVHSNERLLQVEESGKVDKVLYDCHELNQVGLVTKGTEEMEFKLCFNCVSSQFPFDLARNQINCNQNLVPIFRLVVETFSDVTGVRFDTVSCLVKIFWHGQAAAEHQLDRYRMIRNNVQFCTSLSNSTTQTCLTPYNKNESNKINSKLKITTKSTPIYPKLGQFCCEDERKLLCALNAPTSSSLVNLNSKSVYQLLLKPLNFHCAEIYKTSIRLSFDKSPKEVFELMNNLSAMKSAKLLELDYVHCQLDQTVLDIQRSSTASLDLIWCPESEIKLAFQFNCTSQEFKSLNRNQDLELCLIVETTAKKDNSVIEQSFCQIKLLESSLKNSNNEINNLLKETEQETNQFTILKNGQMKNVLNAKMTINIFYLILNDKNYSTMPFPLSLNMSGLTVDKLKEKLFEPLIQKYVGNQTLKLEQMYYRPFINAYSSKKSSVLLSDERLKQVFTNRHGYKLELEPVINNKKSRSTVECNTSVKCTYQMSPGSFNFPAFPSSSPLTNSNGMNFAKVGTPSSVEESNYNLYITECFLS